MPPVSSHFYPDQLYVSNTTSNGRKYSKSILRKSQRFPTKLTTQIDAVYCQALRHLLRWPPPPRLHLGFRLDHHHHLVIYTRFLSFLKKKERWRRNNSFWGYFFLLISVGFWHELGISWIRGFQKPWGKFLKKKKKLILCFFGWFFLGLSHGFVFFVRLYSWEVDSGGFLEDSKKYSGIFIWKPDLPLLLLHLIFLCLNLEWVLLEYTSMLIALNWV